MKLTINMALVRSSGTACMTAYSQLHVERPLREWEIVLDVLSVWEPDASNALLVKKYSYHYTLTSEVRRAGFIREKKTLKLGTINRVSCRKRSLQCTDGYL